MNQDTNPFDQSFGSLDTLAETIYGELRCPVTIEDTNHRLLAYSSHEDMTDPARISTIMGRKVPDKVISTLWRDGVMKRLLQSELPIRISAMGEIGLGDRVAIAIRRNQEVLGYIWLLEVNEPLGEHGLHLLKRAADAARSLLIQLQMKSRKEEKSYHDFFWQLLTGHLQLDETVRERAKLLGVRLPERYHVTVSVRRSHFRQTPTANPLYVGNDAFRADRSACNDRCPIGSVGGGAFPSGRP
ncbi:hypothetical protein [Cohnella thermotolerans]|uniref:hypothetical protein n=1 Tax=Cohnella thermotolerans TaxID=329858 RepID=UPI000412C738|nr:hypothetical protein [Cohnella thermotolerans]